MIASASICGEDSDTVNSLNQNGGSRPDPNTVEMVRYYKKAQEEHGFRLIDSIRQNKEFGNPYILTKVVEHFKIDQIGSNYPKNIFDPLDLTPDEFEDSFKRRKTTTPAPTVIASVQYGGSDPTAPVQSAQAPPQLTVPLSGVAPAQAAALAAALAAINASVANRSNPATVEGDKEGKRKSKWG